MSELPLARSAIYSKLAGGTALTSLLYSGTAIFWQQAPDDYPLPYVVFNLQAGGPDNETPSDSWNDLYWIRAYAARPDLAGSIDYQIHALLHKAALTVAGYTNFWTARESNISMVEASPSGEKIWAMGGLYRVRLDS